METWLLSRQREQGRNPGSFWAWRCIKEKFNDHQQGVSFLWTCGSISPKTNNIVGVPRCEAQRGVASQLAHAGGHTGSTFSVCDAHRTRISHNAAP